jgi:uncharacterized protein YjbI with pentapeptide repeats
MCTKIHKTLQYMIINIIIMYWRQGLALLLSVIICCVAYPALADWTHPLSFSNAELARHDFSGQSLQAAEFSNANLEMANFAGADLRGTVFSASVMTKANLHGANLTNALVNEVKLNGADLSDAILLEALLLRSLFTDVNIEGADFSDAILDRSQIQELCKKASGVNSQTGVETRESLGCR